MNLAAAAYFAESISRRVASRRPEFGITAIEEIEAIVVGESFLLSDLNRKWWKIAYIQS